MKRLLNVRNPVVERLLSAPHIVSRRLMLLPSPAAGTGGPSSSVPSSASLSREHSNVGGGGMLSPQVAQHYDGAPLQSSSTFSSPAAPWVDSTTPAQISRAGSPPPAAGRSDSTSPDVAPLLFASGSLGKENSGALNERFQLGLQTIGVEAARRALRDAGVSPSDVSCVVAVTSTGLSLPGFSAILQRDLALPRDVQRLDIVGMGCNAGMSALRNLSTIISADPEGVGLLVCCEICSALYVNDDTAATGIVNSLFGDGAVAMVLRGGDDATGAMAPSRPEVRLVDFTSATLPEYFDDMMYVVPPEHDRLCFRLSKRIPFAVGDNVHVPVLALLERHRLTTADVAHWIVHTGGAAVMTGIKRNLGLSDDALRHTASVLRDYGNVSSGSFLVSLERLFEEHRQSGGSVIVAGDRVVLIAMGPGATIEVGLGICCH